MQTLQLVDTIPLSTKMERINVQNLDSAISLFEKRVRKDLEAQYKHLKVVDCRINTKDPHFPYLELEDTISQTKFRFLNASTYKNFLKAVNHPPECYPEPIDSVTPQIYTEYLSHRISHTEGRDLFRLIQVEGIWYCRAVLSTKYAVLNHEILLKEIKPFLQDLGADAQIELYASVNNMNLRINLETSYNASMSDPFTIWQEIRNGETGEAQYENGYGIKQKVCDNGLITTTTKMKHLGSNIQGRVVDELRYNRELMTFVPIQIRNASRTGVIVDRAGIKKLIAQTCKNLGVSDEWAIKIDAYYDLQKHTTNFSLWKVISAFTYAANQCETTNEKLIMQELAGNLLMNPQKYFTGKMLQDLEVLETKDKKTMGLPESYHFENVPQAFTQKELTDLGIRAEKFIHLKDEIKKVLQVDFDKLLPTDPESKKYLAFENE